MCNGIHNEERGFGKNRGGKEKTSDLARLKGPTMGKGEK